MNLYPTIMCGGAGTRLWPASRPSRPKQFIALAGDQSLFQDTVTRVSSLAVNEGQIVVVAGVPHRSSVETQLAEIGVSAQILLEPEARDSAAAMAAAALWVQQRDPDGIIVFVASDHFIPDDSAFRRAVTAAASGAARGQIVTLGIRPDAPSSAYGYIKPAGTGLSPIVSFHEKPDSQMAQAFVQAGYLWNSGNFIVSASTLIEELASHAPAVLSAASSALATSHMTRSALVLGESFRSAPKISIDYAVMEPTKKASVLEVDFSWSDLGAWDAVEASGKGNTGVQILEDSERILARVPDGKILAAIGVRDLGIIVEDDAVLVCSLGRSQEVKRLVERVKIASPQHLDFGNAEHEGLGDGARRLADWLRLRALPVWATLGFGADGGFNESLSLDGRTIGGHRRARVQTRQIFAYAQAAMMGWNGPWKSTIEAAFKRLRASYLRPDGQTRTLLGADWRVIDERAMLYDQAFLILALAAAKQSNLDDVELEIDAAHLRDNILARPLPNGAFLETGTHPFQSNAHMHLLEASMAWELVSTAPAWAALVDRIANLAIDVFIDREDGFIREFFDENWAPAEGDDGRLVEPGHQFEWAWLLARYSLLRNDDRAAAAARVLYANGTKGISQQPPVAIDAMNDDMTIRSGRARLWPQTEWLKSSLILAEISTSDVQAGYLDDARVALQALWLYLTESGLWRDKRLANGEFLDEPAPASSLYHIVTTFDQLARTINRLNISDCSLDLS